MMPDTDTPLARKDLRTRFARIPFRVLLPNLVTLLAICSGLTAIRLAIEGKLDWAIFAVALAAILDGLDGRLARLLKGTSRFGAELDSLCDFVNFGVVPALMLYLFSLKAFRSFGWIVALLFAIAMALRLARFNVMLDDPDKPAWHKNFFTGVPAPAGALCALLPIYLYFIGLPRFPGLGLIELVYVLVVASLLVSRIPTYSGKSVGSRVPREWLLPILILVVLFFVVLASYPFEMLTALTLGYLGLIPFSVARYQALTRADAEALAPATQEQAQEKPKQAGEAAP